MTAPRPQESPIVRFLGEDAGAGGPFALLGLPHSIASDEQITRALNRRLQQLGSHRQRSTPDADEVRLALYSAASQLLDPALRHQLARRWPEGTPIVLPKAWKPTKAMAHLSPQFLHRARMVVASSGGWNRAARKRLAHLARLHRVNALDVVRALSPQSPPASRGPAIASEPAVDRQDRTLIEPPAGGGWLGAYAVLTLMAVLLLLTMAVNPPTTTRSTPASEATPGLASTPGAAPDHATNAQPTVRENLAHYTAIAHELELLAGAARSDPRPSLDRFKTVYPRFADSWTDFPPAALERSTLHIASFISGIAGSDLGIEPLAPVLACTRPDPDRLMIGAAVLDVALSGPGLGAADRSVLEALRTRCVPTDPRPASKVMGSLLSIAGDLAARTPSDDPAWWEGWLKGVKAASGEDSQRRSELVVAALIARLRDKSQPGSGWDRTARMLVGSLSWRAGSDERLWLLSQFADAAVTTPRLAALTEAMATASGAEHIDARMVLGPLDNDLQRQQLARAYRDAWFPPPDSDATAKSQADAVELVNELRLAATVVGAGLDEQGSIEAIVSLANLNTAAWLAHDGERLLALDLINNPREPLPAERQPARPGLDATERDRLWAENAINAQGAPELRPLLTQLNDDEGPGVDSAHALVHLATLEPQAELRELALGQLLRYRDRPAVLIAVDHALSTARVSSRLSELVERIVAAPLPPRTDPAWFDAARRQLLPLLARSLAAPDSGDLPALSRLLGELYAMRAGELDAGVGEASPISATLGAEALAGRLRVKYLAAHPEGDGVIERLLSETSVRSARAGSPMQRFLARQRAVVSLMSLLVSDETPGSAGPIDEINQQLTLRLDASNSVLDQIAQTERAIALLWALRLERNAP